MKASEITFKPITDGLAWGCHLCLNEATHFISFHEHADDLGHGCFSLCPNERCVAATIEQGCSKGQA